MGLRESRHRWAFIAFSTIVAFGLPLSNFAMSIGGIGLALNWLLEGNIKRKIRDFLAQPAAVAVTFVFFIYVIGLLWTEKGNLEEGLKSVRIVLPLLLFPAVYSTSPKFSKKELHILASGFLFGVMIAAIGVTAKYLSIIGGPEYNFREASLFISHIRYSLMVCLAVAGCLIWSVRLKWVHSLLLVVLAVLLSLFQVFILQAFTGIVILFFIYLILLCWLAFRLKNKVYRYGILLAVVSIPALGLFWLYQKVDAFFPDSEIDYASLEPYTERGGVYDHHRERKGYENGNPIWTYVCYEELEEAWGLRSDIPFRSGKDARGQYVYTTLIRFLAGKGLRKNYNGVMQLSDEQIRLVEAGVTNESLYQVKPIERRVYQILWELTAYKNDQRIDGNSVVQRLEYWKTGWRIWKQNFILGIGTGDVKEAFANQYEMDNSILSREWRLLAHNQFITIGLLFGIIGLLFFLFSIVLPVYLLPQAKTIIYVSFLIIALLSMVTEDTLNSQAGATFFAFFNALLLFGAGSQDADDKTSR